MRGKKEIIIPIIISICILISVHLFAFILQTNSASSRAYRAWQKNDWKTAQSYREKSLTQNPNNAYNLGTLLAQQSVVSGEVRERNTLQRAESLLSGASAFDLPKKNELMHNLETVRALLAQSGSGQQEQQQQNQSGSSGDNQQQQNTGSGEQNQEEQQQSGAGEPLSESMKQQLQQYQQQLQQEQAQNQQFYGKEQSGSPSGDPFDLLNQFFGGSPQLQQQVGNDGKPDW